MVAMFSRDYFGFGRPPGAIAALDGLRGIAVLLVLLRHAAFPVREATGRPVWDVGGIDLAIPLVNGWIGVDLFFVLSGFLIGGQLLRQRARGQRFDWRRYLLQRFLRIMPTYWFVLGIVVAGLVPLFATEPDFLGLRVAYHVLVLQDYLPPNIVVAFWSLGVEEKFYLVAPLIIMAALAFRRWEAQIAVVGLAVLLPLVSRIVSASGIEGAMTYRDFLPIFRFPFHQCLDALAIGMLCALIHGRTRTSGTAARSAAADILAWGGLTGVALLLCGGELLGNIGWWEQTLQPTAIGLAFGATVLGAALGGGPQRLLASVSLLVAARLSYPLYLIHLTLIPLCWALTGGLQGSGGTALVAFLPIYFLVCFLVSAAIHFFVEKPFLVIKDQIGHAKRIPRAAPAGP